MLVDFSLLPDIFLYDETDDMEQVVIFVASCAIFCLVGHMGMDKFVEYFLEKKRESLVDSLNSTTDSIEQAKIKLDIEKVERAIKIFETISPLLGVAGDKLTYTTLILYIGFLFL